MILDCGMIGANRRAKIRGPKMRVVGRAVSSKTHESEIRSPGGRRAWGVTDYLLRLEWGEGVLHAENLLGITSFFYACFLRIMPEGNLFVFEAV